MAIPKKLTAFARPMSLREHRLGFDAHYLPKNKKPELVSIEPNKNILAFVELHLNKEKITVVDFRLQVKELGCISEQKIDEKECIEILSRLYGFENSKTCNISLSMSGFIYNCNYKNDSCVNYDILHTLAKGTRRSNDKRKTVNSEYY